MRLVRHLDAKGKPFTVTIARCSESPSGLLSGIQQPNVHTDKYCRQTLKNTGDMELAKIAHQTRQVFQPSAKGKGYEAAARKGGQGGWQQQPQPAQAAPAVFPAVATGFPPVPAPAPAPAPAAQAYDDPWQENEEEADEWQGWGQQSGQKGWGDWYPQSQDRWGQQKGSQKGWGQQQNQKGWGKHQ